jgi:7-dehydrocholesterol reductase
LGVLFAVIVFFCGASVIYLQYDLDLNRQLFRDTNGNCLVWGQVPKYIVAEYSTVDGHIHKNLLLVNGGWDIARHFNYTLELILSLCWTVCSKFEFLLPWMYLIFLTILLIDRSRRDERRCAHKYGHYWRVKKNTKKKNTLLLKFMCLF